MHTAAGLHHHRHDRVLIRLTTLLVYAYDLVDLDIAHEVTSDEYEVRRDDAVCVDIAHRVAGSEGFFGGDDGADFDSRGGF